jgi:hypothetical protein
MGTHIKTNGTQCGSPALRGRRFCFFHKNWQGQRIQLNAQPATPLSFTMPVLEDADSVQVALMQVMRLILARQLDPKIAGLLLYALQTASLNLRQMKLEPVHLESVVIDPRAVADNGVGDDAWCEEEEEEGEEEEEDADPDEVGEEEDSEDTEDAGDENEEEDSSEQEPEEDEPAHPSRKPVRVARAAVLSVPDDSRPRPVGSPEPTRTPSSPNSTKTRLPVTCWSSSSDRRPEPSEAGTGGPFKPGFGLGSLDLLGISARGSDAAQPPQLEWGCLRRLQVPLGAAKLVARVAAVHERGRPGGTCFCIH